MIGHSKTEVLPLPLYPDIVNPLLDNLFRNGNIGLDEDLVQPRRDEARAVVTSPALKALEVRVGRTAFLDDNDLDLSIELPGFAKKMDGEKRAGRSTANDGDAITVFERFFAAHDGEP